MKFPSYISSSSRPVTAFLLRACLFAAGLATLQIAVVTLFAHDEDRTVLEALHAAEQERWPIVFFGDSTLEFVSKEDTDERTLEQMVSENLAAWTSSESSRDNSGIAPSTAFIAFPAMRMFVYAAMARHMEKAPYRPRYMIIPVNLRSFAPPWDWFPGWQFVDVFQELRFGAAYRYFKTPMLIFDVTDMVPISEEEYMNSPVYYGNEHCGQLKDFVMEMDKGYTRDLASGFIVSYMSPITSTNRQLVALRDLARTAKRLGVTPLFYLTPTDYEEGVNQLGEDLRRQLEANAKVVTQALADEVAPSLDLTFALDHSHFDYHHMPDEHLRDTGRVFLANQITDWIKAQEAAQASLR